MGKDFLQGVDYLFVYHQEEGTNAFGGRIMHCGTIMDYLCYKEWEVTSNTSGGGG